MVKQCKWCNVAFTTQKNNKIFCSKQCKIFNVRRNVVERNQKIVEKVCNRCLQIFRTSNSSYKFCSDKCRYPEKTENILKDTQKCKWCDINITLLHNHYPFCSLRCEESHNIDNKHVIQLTECKHCDRLFNQTKSNRKFCSNRCLRKESTQNDQDKRTKLKIEYLEKTECSVCLRSFPSQCLAFHHISDKKFNLSKTNYGRYSKEEIIDEIAKTVKVCHNCHAIIHHNEHRLNTTEVLKTTEYKRTIREHRKKELIKICGSECKSCQLRSDVMDVFTFDHIGEKRFNLSKSEIGSRKWEDILYEVDQCELLCLNCHHLKNILPVSQRRIPINELLKSENISLILKDL